MTASRLPRCFRASLLVAAVCAGCVLVKGHAVAFEPAPLQKSQFALPVLLADAPKEPDGFRMGDYRSAVPATLAGAVVLKTERALELWDAKAARFIDVLPRPPKPAGLAEGTVWRPPERRNIPGSEWLANVGFGKLNPQVSNYFKTNLERISGGDVNAPLVFYCLAKCWMSWNAAKRALGYGYTSVYWYPDGSDGWAIAGGTLEISEPVPMSE